MTVKRAHMVTRGYLEGWANSRGLVYVWDGETPIAGVRSLGDATVVGYAYRTEHTTLDLEAHYAGIEGRGVAAFRSLTTGGTLTSAGRSAVIEFLDMHLERGRYADQARVRMPIAMGDFSKGGFQMAEMGLGDRLVLSESMNKEAIRIALLGVDRWPLRVATVNSGLITGDGAVLMWERADGSGIQTVSFPLAQNKLLILGEPLPHVPINALIANNCRRWLIDHVEGNVARSMPSR